MEHRNNLKEKTLQIQQESIKNQEQQKTNPNQTINKTSNSNQQINETDSNNFFARFYLDFYYKNTDLSQAPFKQWLNKNEDLPQLDREWILRGDLSTSDNEFIKGYKKLLDNNSRIDSAEANGYSKNKGLKFIEPESTEFAEHFIKQCLISLYNGAPSNPQHAKSNLLSTYPKLEKNLELLDKVYQYAIRDELTKFNDFITDYKYKQKEMAEKQKKITDLKNTFKQPN